MREFFGVLEKNNSRIQELSNPLTAVAENFIQEFRTKILHNVKKLSNPLNFRKTIRISIKKIELV